MFLGILCIIYITVYAVLVDVDVISIMCLLLSLLLSRLASLLLLPELP